MVGNQGFHRKIFRGLSGGDFTGGGGRNSNLDELFLKPTLAEREREQERINNALEKHDQKYRESVRQDWAKGYHEALIKRELERIPYVPVEDFKFRVVEANRIATVVYSDQGLATNVFVTKHPNSDYYIVRLHDRNRNRDVRIFNYKEVAQRYAFYLAYKEVQKYGLNNKT